MGDVQMIDSMVHDGLWGCLDDIHMGITAENVAESTASAVRTRTSSPLAARKGRASRRRRNVPGQIVPIEVR